MSARRGGRVVECTGLENRRAARYRGFESHPLRSPMTPIAPAIGVCRFCPAASRPAAESPGQRRCRLRAACKRGGCGKPGPQARLAVGLQAPTPRDVRAQRANPSAWREARPRVREAARLHGNQAPRRPGPHGNRRRLRPQNELLRPRAGRLTAQTTSN